MFCCFGSRRWEGGKRAWGSRQALVGGHPPTSRDKSAHQGPNTKAPEDRKAKPDVGPEDPVVTRMLANIGLKMR